MGINSKNITNENIENITKIIFFKGALLTLNFLLISNKIEYKIIIEKNLLGNQIYVSYVVHPIFQQHKHN